MYLLKKSLEIAELKETIEELERQLWIERENRAYDARLAALAMETERIKVRKEMEKDLITSDLQRVDALASLKAYREMDNKDDRKHIRTMLADAIKSLGNKSVTINQK